MMADGVEYGHHELFQFAQQDAWDRTSRVLRDIHNYGILIAQSFGGGAVKESQMKTADDCNDWLRVPGNLTPDEEKKKLGDAIIAQREKEARERNGGK